MITAKQLAEALKHNVEVIDNTPGLTKMHYIKGWFDLEAVAAELNKVACDKKVDRQ